MPANTAEPQAERTYPREWYRVCSWSSRPEARLFQRETEARLYWSTAGGRERFENKFSQHAQWFPTHEAAEAVIAARKANEAERERLELIRAAAPELLAAVIQYRDDLRHPIDEDSRQRRLAMVEAAISKATSRQPEGER